MAFVKIPKSVIKKIDDVVKLYGNKSVIITTEEKEDRIIVSMTGMGLVHQMSDPFMGRFNRFFIGDFERIDKDHDCFARIDFATSGMIVLSWEELSVPSIEITFFKQKKPNKT